MKTRRDRKPYIFYKAIAVANYELGLSPGEARTLGALCLFYPNIQPSQALLSAKIGYHRNTLTQHLNQLEKAGHIEVVRRYRQRSLYTITPQTWKKLKQGSIKYRLAEEVKAQKTGNDSGVEAQKTGNDSRVKAQKMGKVISQKQGINRSTYTGIHNIRTIKEYEIAGMKAADVEVDGEYFTVIEPQGQRPKPKVKETTLPAKGSPSAKALSEPVSGSLPGMSVELVHEKDASFQSSSVPAIPTPSPLPTGGEPEGNQSPPAPPEEHYGIFSAGNTPGGATLKRCIKCKRNLSEDCFIPGSDFCGNCQIGTELARDGAISVESLKSIKGCVLNDDGAVTTVDGCRAEPIVPVKTPKRKYGGKYGAPRPAGLKLKSPYRVDLVKTDLNQSYVVRKPGEIHVAMGATEEEALNKAYYFRPEMFEPEGREAA